MTRPTLDLARLRACAEKATPGPRVVEEPSDGTIRIETRGRTIASVWAAAFDGEPAFLSTFDRETCLALLDRLEAATGALAAITITYHSWHSGELADAHEDSGAHEAMLAIGAALPGKAP